MAREIKGSLYRIEDQKGTTVFVDCENLEDLFRFVARKVLSGVLVTDISEINADKTTPRVKVLSAPGFKKILEEERKCPSSDSGSIKVPVAHGVFDIQISVDPAYPGVDVEYTPDSISDEVISLPRILFEEDDGELAVRVWAKGDSEDESEKIIFDQVRFG